MEIWQMSATSVAHGVRTGAFSSVEATRSMLARIAEVNPEANAIVEVRADDALSAAREADVRLRHYGPDGPLHGVPVTFKVSTGMAGLATTEGVAAYAGHIATETDPQATSWQSAGAIFVGRTNCPPFATRWTTENDLYGTTLNPWNPAVTPGGSSGGASAAVALGMGALAHGSDIGGSIRYPAACCGVVGIRPTSGRVPGWAGPPSHDPPMAVQAFVEQGPLARTVADLRLGLRAMETYDPRDPRAVALTSRVPAAREPGRVAVVTGTGGAGLRGSTTKESAEATRTAAAWLADAGYQVEEVELPLLGEAARLWWLLALTEFQIGMVAEVERVGDPDFRRFFDLMFAAYREEFGVVDLPAFVAGWARRGMLRREMSMFMDQYPLVLTPVSGEPPFAMGADAESAERTAELMGRQWPSMSVPVLGLPALGQPAVLGSAGAPVGVQVIGRAFEEEAVFAAAEVIEARSGIVTPIEPARSQHRESV
ncbi:amidase [Spongiactinospora sp. TRM90649]|uniref:amidase n=1 Tax=Spongiactinospora sp. TRM90649 TaxID=3031114 RepID=UPI0023F6D722|nr:amidase [Spongiactinospora sp. TRM90649]MDF5753573.1 amidase [Spongiactinospora sp. TRM90649]